MKKLLSIFAMVIGIAVASRAQEPTALTINVTIQVEGTDTTAKVTGIDDTHFVIFLGREVGDNIKTPRCFIVLRRDPFSLKTLELYYGIAGTPLTKATEVTFQRDVNDDTKTIGTMKNIGAVAFIKQRAVGYWEKPGQPKIFLARTAVLP